MSTLISGLVVISCLQTVELFSRDLLADGAGDDQNAWIDPTWHRVMVRIRRLQQRAFHLVICARRRALVWNHGYRFRAARGSALGT